MSVRGDVGLRAQNVSGWGSSPTCNPLIQKASVDCSETAGLSSVRGACASTRAMLVLASATAATAARSAIATACELTRNELQNPLIPQINKKK